MAWPLTAGPPVGGRDGVERLNDCCGARSVIAGQPRGSEVESLIRA